jgi:hypothetical protein
VSALVRIGFQPLTGVNVRIKIRDYDFVILDVFKLKGTMLSKERKMRHA